MSDSKPPRNSSDLPLNFRVFILTLLAVTFVVHLFVDIWVKDYDGKGTSYLLGSIVGCAFGFNTVIAEFLKGRNNQ